MLDNVIIADVELAEDLGMNIDTRDVVLPPTTADDNDVALIVAYSFTYDKALAVPTTSGSVGSSAGTGNLLTADESAFLVNGNAHEGEAYLNTANDSCNLLSLTKRSSSIESKMRILPGIEGC